MLTVLGRNVKIDFSNHCNMDSMIEIMKSQRLYPDTSSVINDTVAYSNALGPKNYTRIEMLRNLHIPEHEDDIFKRYFLFYVLEAHGQTIYAQDHKVDSKRKCLVRPGEKNKIKVKAGDLFVLDSHMEHSMSSPFFKREKSISHHMGIKDQRKYADLSLYALVVDLSRIPSRDLAMSLFDSSTWKWKNRSDCNLIKLSENRS